MHRIARRQTGRSIPDILCAGCDPDSELHPRSRRNRKRHQCLPEDKFALFRQLFRGRDDVYARRFESRRGGKSGYASACGNEWVAGVCDKPRIKCTACLHQRFLQATDEAVRWHLSGQDDAGHDFVMGIYSLLRDETCFFLAIDLDKQDWQNDAWAVMNTCRHLGLPRRAARQSRPARIRSSSEERQQSVERLTVTHQQPKFVS